LVAVTYFLRGLAKDLSAPRYKSFRTLRPLNMHLQHQLGQQKEE